MSLVLLDILLLMVAYLFHYCSLAGEDFLHGIGLTIAWLFCICIIILKSYLKEKSIHSSAVILYNLDRIVNWQLTLSEWGTLMLCPLQVTLVIGSLLGCITFSSSFSYRRHSVTLSIRVSIVSHWIPPLISLKIKPLKWNSSRQD